MKSILFGMAVLLVASLVFQGGALPPAPSPQVAKGWTQAWGGNGADDARRVATDEAGNVYVVGEFSGTVDFDPAPASADFHTSYNGSIDAFVSKYDVNGDFLWAKTWGGSRRDVAYGVGVDAAGSAYVVGPFMDTVDFNPDPSIDDIHASNGISGTVYQNNIYLSKFSADGTYRWVRTWGPAYVLNAAGGAEAYSVAVDGNFLYVVGDFSGGTTDFNPWGGHDYHTNHPPVIGPIFFDAFLSKFDLNGNFQWAKTWGGEGYDDGPGVAVDSAGNVYIAGMYASQTINFDPAGGAAGLGHPAHDSGAMVDVFLSKFDSGGNFQWVKTWGGQGTEDAMGTIVLDSADNVYVAGRFASIDCDFNPGGTPDLHSTHGDQDAFVSKFTPGGAFQWARTWGGSDSDSAMGLAVDERGNVEVAGWFSQSVDFDPGSAADNHSSNGQRDAFISQFDAGGTFQWAKTWGGSGDDRAGVTADGRGNLYTAGQFAGTVEFDPIHAGDPHTSSDNSLDAFLSQFLFLTHPIYLPVVVKMQP